MQKPKMRQFDGWKSSAVGQWFFREYLQDYADSSAMENGRQFGRVEETAEKEVMTAARNAGVIQGVDDVINGIRDTEEESYNSQLDPFAEEREEQEDESGGDGEIPPD